jgi:hypothetical protein
MNEMKILNYKNEIWSENVIKTKSKWVISTENMKWKHRLYNENYIWLYKVFLSERSNVISNELKMNESVYFNNLEKSESVYFNNLLFKQKKSALALMERGKTYDVEKERAAHILNITPYFWGFRRGHFLNDNTNVLNNKLVDKGEVKLREYYRNLIGQNYRDLSLYNLFYIGNKVRSTQKIKRMGLKQIIDEKYSNIVSRKMENRLSTPHYFFTNRYITRSNILPQIRNWPNTIYSYIKPTIVNIKYVDLVTTEFIKVFFNPSLLKRKVIKGNISDLKVFTGISIVPVKLFTKFLNEMIRFTSNRSQADIKDVTSYTSNLLWLPWAKRELGWAKTFKKLLKARRSKFERGFTPKRAVLFNKNRNIWLSKPLFRHTASNVIIDLYLFNNKSYKLGKYHHMIKLRALYKYMYSMYANYDDIIQTIISRPRIFYINIIEPKMHAYYYRVIRSYENTLIYLSKSQFIYLLLNILKWNLNNKIFAFVYKYTTKLTFSDHINNNHNSINRELSKNSNKSVTTLPVVDNNYHYNNSTISYNNDNDSDNKNYNDGTIVSSSSFGKWVTKKSNNKIQEYIPLKWNDTSSNVNSFIFKSLRLKSKINKYRSIYNTEKNNIFINDYSDFIDNNVYIIKKKRIHSLSWWKNEYYLLKEFGPKYNIKAVAKQRMKDLEKYASTPLRKEDYPSWSKELLLEQKERYKKGIKNKNTRKVKIFGTDKFSLKKYKWKLKKGKNLRTLSSKFWDEQLMKYNQYSKSQKANINPNLKWVYDNKTKLKVHISKYEGDTSIFDKIKKKKDFNKTLKLKTKLGDFKPKLNLEYKKNQPYKGKYHGINKNEKKPFINKGLVTNFNNINTRINTKNNNSQRDFIPLISRSKNKIYNNSNTLLSQFEMDSHNNKFKMNYYPVSKREIIKDTRYGFTVTGMTGIEKTQNNKYAHLNYKDKSNNIQSAELYNENSFSKFESKNSINWKGNVNIKNKNEGIRAEIIKKRGRIQNDFSKKDNISINKEWRTSKHNNNFNLITRSSSGFINKNKIHTLRQVSKVKYKYVKINKKIKVSIKKENLIINNLQLLKGLLRLLRIGKINKSRLVNKIYKVNISNVNHNTLLNIEKELYRIEKIQNIQIKKEKYVYLWNLLNKNWSLSEFNNKSAFKENVIKGKVERKINYIKHLKDNFKNDEEALNEKLNIIIKVDDMNENNKYESGAVLNLVNYLKWDELDTSVIKMLLLLMMSKKKRVYNNNIETYLKLKRKDTGRWRPKSKKKIRLESDLSLRTNGNINSNNNKLNKKIRPYFNKFIHYSYEKLVSILRNKFINNNKLYIDIIRQEFYKVNRDVIVTKTMENISYESNSLNNSYDFGYITNNINTTFTLAWDEIREFSVKLWQTLNFNRREENLMHILNFSDKAFKPYYRYMIRLFILGEYRKFISRLGFKNILLHLKMPLDFNKFTWFKDNNLKIFNFIVVKTLFNIFTYSYRSLYILKPKFYHINKLRLYKRKAKRLKFNTWLKSTKYVKILRKAPNSYWLRYHKLINVYYKRILHFAKLDTGRKILIPYVIYFEDVLYNIYGKLALIRIWPLKYYFLSIFILSERLMLLLDKNAHRKKRRKSLTALFTRFVFKFVNVINATKIDRFYEANLGNNSRWPTELLSEINKNLPLASNYNKLEYFSDRLELPYTLNSYLFKYGQLDDFLPIPEFNYSKQAKDLYIKVKDKKNFNLIRYGLVSYLKKGFIQYWTRPIKNMLWDINNTQDIRGILFKLAGRAKGKPRKYNVWYQRGSFLGARHYNKLTRRYITLSSSYIRNSVKATMDYTQRSATFPAGVSNLKVWYGSLLSSDIMELIFYMSKKKVIYNAIMNRNFFVHKNINYFVNYNKWTNENNISLLHKLNYQDNKEKKIPSKFNKPYNKKRYLRLLNTRVRSSY